MKRAPIVIVVIAAVAGGAYYLLRHRSAGDGLSASGTVEATEASLGFQAAGRIERIRVNEGDRVKAGDTLAVLPSGVPVMVTTTSARFCASRGVVEAAPSLRTVSLNVPGLSTVTTPASSAKAMLTAAAGDGGAWADAMVEDRRAKANRATNRRTPSDAWRFSNAWWTGRRRKPGPDDPQGPGGTAGRAARGGSAPRGDAPSRPQSHRRTAGAGVK